MQSVLNTFCKLLNSVDEGPGISFPLQSVQITSANTDFFASLRSPDVMARIVLMVDCITHTWQNFDKTIIIMLIL